MKKQIKLLAPVNGKAIALEEVKDPLFSRKLMGDGVAIIPTSNTVYSPIKGKIILTAVTKHAIGILAEDDTEILLHIGIDTVHLNGKGFEMHIENGDMVDIHTPLLTFNRDFLSDTNIDMTTMIIITKSNDAKIIQKNINNNVSFSIDEILEINHK